MKLPVITNSEITTWRRCQREHRYAYVLGFRPIKRDKALTFGEAWHVSMETYWSHGPRAMSSAIANGCALLECNYERAALRSLLVGYEARWGSEYLDKTVDVEKTFEFYIEDCNISGKIDVLLKDGFVEHKTTSSNLDRGSVYWDKLALDTQVSTYFLGAKSLWVTPEYCLYDVVRKPQLKPKDIPVIEDGCVVVVDENGARAKKKDGSWRASPASGQTIVTKKESSDEYSLRVLEEISAKPEAYFARELVTRSDSQLRSFAEDLSHFVSDIREAEACGIAPRNPDACSRYGKLCPYFGVCTGVDDLFDSEKFKQVEDRHQELMEAL